MAHEGHRKAIRQRMEAIEGDLSRFVWMHKESLQPLYDRLMVPVKKIKTLCSND